MNGGAQEDRVGFPLDANSILPGRIDQPGLFL